MYKIHNALKIAETPYDMRIAIGAVASIARQTPDCARSQEVKEILRFARGKLAALQNRVNIDRCSVPSLNPQLTEFKNTAKEMTSMGESAALETRSGRFTHEQADAFGRLFEKLNTVGTRLLRSLPDTEAACQRAITNELERYGFLFKNLSENIRETWGDWFSRQGRRVGVGGGDSVGSSLPEIQNPF